MLPQSVFVTGNFFAKVPEPGSEVAPLRRRKAGSALALRAATRSGSCERNSPQGVHQSSRKYCGSSIHAGACSPNSLHQYSAAPASSARYGLRELFRRRDREERGILVPVEFMPELRPRVFEVIAQLIHEIPEFAVVAGPPRRCQPCRRLARLGLVVDHLPGNLVHCGACARHWCR